MGRRIKDGTFEDASSRSKWQWAIYRKFRLKKAWPWVEMDTFHSDLFSASFEFFQDNANFYVAGEEKNFNVRSLLSTHNWSNIFQFAMQVRSFL
jgi:hypothetical protein